MVVEISDPAHRSGQKLSAVVEGQEPGRQGCGHLVRVTDAVDARKAIFPEKLLVAEGQGRAIKNRQGALVLILDVEVIKPGFEGLEEAIAPEAQVPLEAEPCIHAGRGQASVRRFFLPREAV